MPTQTFRIIRAPEEKPLTTNELRHLIWVSRPKSDWEVKEIKEEVPKGKDVEKIAKAAL